MTGRMIPQCRDRNRAPFCALLLLAVLLSACSKAAAPRLAVDIMTRAGDHFVLAHVELNYERICEQGTYPLKGDPDTVGLRIFLPTGDALFDHADPKFKDIAWPAITSVSFAEPNGDAGDYCGNRPAAIFANVTFKDGHQEEQNLLDTTDRGLSGITDRGPVMVPLREIASLKPIEDAHWPWVETYDPADREAEIRRRDRATLHVSLTDQTRQDMPASVSVIYTRKELGNRSLDPVRSSVIGFPIFRRGVRFVIFWAELSHVEVSQAYPKIATLTFTDGHQEKGELPDGLIDGAAGDSIDFGKISAIDVSIVTKK